MSRPLSYIELSRDALVHNIRALRSIVKKGTKFAVAVKGNAYGHGLREVVHMAGPHVDHFIVNSVEELALVRKQSKKSTFVLGYVQTADLSKAIKLGCIMGVFSLGHLQKIDAASKRLKKKQEVHIAVDALLGREGFLAESLPELFAEAKKLKSIRIAGMYAHFANIEDTANFTHAAKQIKEYAKAVALAKRHDFAGLATHISATSGLLVYEKDKGWNQLVRVGIGMYGLWPSTQTRYQVDKKEGKLSLWPVLSWKTHVAQVKTLPAGRTIGYGLTYMVESPTKIAVIPQGYADGLGRDLSNKGEVLIGGKRCRILGRVSMNMIVVDVTHVEHVAEGDAVVIIGKQEEQEITAEDIAEKTNSINYEVVTKISPLLPRIMV